MTPEEAKQIYDALIAEAQAMNLEKTKEVYTEIHHINPKSFGGTDEKENLVRMLPRKHFEAHWAQSFMWPEGSWQWMKMSYALDRMSNGLQKDRYDIMADEYEHIRTIRAHAVSVNNKGRKGYKHTLEARKNMSIAQKIIQNIPEVKEKRRLAALGQKRSPQQCQNMKVAQNRPKMRQRKSEMLVMM